MTDAAQKLNRMPYLDYLRVAACFYIMLLHVAAQNWSNVDAASCGWTAMNVYNGLARFGVTAFLMISGALMIGRDIPLKTLLTKYILRLLIAYVVWGVVYALYDGGGINAMVGTVVKGYYHMWYVPMTMGLYLCQPVLHQLAQKKKVLRYFVILAIIFAYAIPGCVQLAKSFGGETLGKLADLGSGFIGNMKMNMVITFSAPFALGYVLSKTDFSRKAQGWLYAAGVLGLLLTVGLNYAEAKLAGTQVTTWLDNFRPGILAYAVYMFVWFRYRMNREGRLYGLIKRLSKYSFGAYLVHPLILDLLDRAGLNTLSFTPWVSVPVIAALVFVPAMAVSALLHLIPGVRKYCV